MRAVYFSDKGNTNHHFFSKEDCEKYEKEQEEIEKRFEEGRKKFDSNLIKEELIAKINKQSTIPIGTIATCSYDCLSIKEMVKVCQNFVEEYKKFLNYY